MWNRPSSSTSTWLSKSSVSTNNYLKDCRLSSFRAFQCSKNLKSHLVTFLKSVSEDSLMKWSSISLLGLSSQAKFWLIICRGLLIWALSGKVLWKFLTTIMTVWYLTDPYCTYPNMPIMVNYRWYTESNQSLFTKQWSIPSRMPCRPIWIQHLLTKTLYWCAYRMTTSLDYATSFHPHTRTFSNEL